jgi:hypothetical protein
LRVNDAAWLSSSKWLDGWSGVGADDDTCPRNRTWHDTAFNVDTSSLA